MRRQQKIICTFQPGRLTSAGGGGWGCFLESPPERDGGGVRAAAVTFLLRHGQPLQLRSAGTRPDSPLGLSQQRSALEKPSGAGGSGPRGARHRTCGLAWRCPSCRAALQAVLTVRARYQELRTAAHAQTAAPPTLCRYHLMWSHQSSRVGVELDLVSFRSRSARPLHEPDGDMSSSLIANPCSWPCRPPFAQQQLRFALQHATQHVHHVVFDAAQGGASRAQAGGPAARLGFLL